MHEEESPQAADHLVLLGNLHRKRIQEHAEEFEANVNSKRMGATATTTRSLEGGGGESNAAADPIFYDSGGGGIVCPVSRDAEVRMQRYAVVSVIADDSQTCRDLQQPAIIVWDAVDTEEEAKAIIKNGIGHDVSDVHLDVVAMYEWLFPTAIDFEKVTEEYRDEKLNDLMQHRKTEHQRVSDFRKLCEKQGREVPTITLGSEEEDERRPLVLPPSEPPMLTNLDPETLTPLP